MTTHDRIIIGGGPGGNLKAEPVPGLFAPVGYADGSLVNLRG